MLDCDPVAASIALDTLVAAGHIAHRQTGTGAVSYLATRSLEPEPAGCSTAVPARRTPRWRTV